MESNDIYRRCITTLYEKTYGKFEHDEEKAIELFDKLLDEGLSSHCDTVKKLCLEAGYGEHAAGAIAAMYDTISLYKAYKKKAAPIQYWDLSKFLQG